MGHNIQDSQPKGCVLNRQAFLSKSRVLDVMHWSESAFRAAKIKGLPTKTIGKCVWVRESDLYSWMEGQERA